MKTDHEFHELKIIRAIRASKGCTKFVGEN
jgi:hypothetical protein